MSRPAPKMLSARLPRWASFAAMTGMPVAVALGLSSLLTILDGATNSGYVTIAPGVITAGDYFTLDVVQVGSTSPGLTLTVTFWMKVTI